MLRQINLFIFFGLIATGKSTLARNWAAKGEMAYYNSDRVRKELAGLAPECRRKESLDQGIYTKEFSRKTYSAMLERAEKELSRGGRVVLDGSYMAEDERRRVREMADSCGADLCFILCECPETVIKERLAQRAQDPNAVSDGRWDIYLQQKKRFTPPVELPPEQLLVFSTADPVDKLLAELEKQLAVNTLP
jgi:predicted kinase